MASQHQDENRDGKIIDEFLEFFEPLFGKLTMSRRFYNWDMNTFRTDEAIDPAIKELVFSWTLKHDQIMELVPKRHQFVQARWENQPFRSALLDIDLLTGREKRAMVHVRSGEMMSSFSCNDFSPANREVWLAKFLEHSFT